MHPSLQNQIEKMRYFFIIILMLLMVSIGVISFGFYVKFIEKSNWYYLLLIPATIFLTYPAVKDWSRYFKELFDNKP